MRRRYTLRVIMHLSVKGGVSTSVRLSATWLLIDSEFYTACSGTSCRLDIACFRVGLNLCMTCSILCPTRVVMKRRTVCSVTWLELVRLRLTLTAIVFGLMWTCGNIRRL